MKGRGRDTDTEGCVMFCFLCSFQDRLEEKGKGRGEDDEGEGGCDLLSEVNIEKGDKFESMKPRPQCRKDAK